MKSPNASNCGRTSSDPDISQLSRLGPQCQVCACQTKSRKRGSAGQSARHHFAPGAHHLILIFPNSHALARSVKQSSESRSDSLDVPNCPAGDRVKAGDIRHAAISTDPSPRSRHEKARDRVGGNSVTGLNHLPKIKEDSSSLRSVRSSSGYDRSQEARQLVLEHASITHGVG